MVVPCSVSTLRVQASRGFLPSLLSLFILMSPCAGEGLMAATSSEPGPETAACDPSQEAPTVADSASTQEGPAYSDAELAEAARVLRQHYYDRAWELASIYGKPFAQAAPDAMELQAWYALNLARDGYPERGIEVADALLDRAPEDSWAWFALAGSVFRDSDRSAEALDASERALSLDPDNMDVLSLRADVIRVEEGEAALMGFLETLSQEQRDHPLIQIRKAVALHAMASEEDATVTEEEAFDAFRAVMALDTTFVEPVFFLATRLQSANRLEEALPLLKRGARLSPSYQVHQYYWRGLQAQRDVPAEEKLAQVEAAMQEFEKMGGMTAGALLAMGQVYEQAGKTEVRDSLWDWILAEYPDFGSAEWVLVNRYREMNRTLAEQLRAGEEQDPALKARYRRALEEFLLRPEHLDERLKGDAYRSLLYLLRDDEEVDGEFLYSVVRGVELFEGINTHIIHGMAPILLADHGVHLDYAESLAKAGFEKAREGVEEAREYGIFESDEEYERSLAAADARIRDALAWVYFARGNLDDAEGELLEAYGESEVIPSVLMHLGKLYEERSALAQTDGQNRGEAESYLDQAQDFYLKGTLIPTPGANPNDEALEELYRERHGSLDGLDAYLTAAEEEDADTRKEKVLDARLEEAKAFTDFALETLDGDTVSSADLDGKALVINFWGTWCGPCVIEMPEIQAFYDQYRDDPAVAVLTIANDPDPDVVRRFMEEKGFSFPVLLDDGYVRDVNVRAFPTTWFVDPDGKIWFEKMGWSEELAQEFSWRIESLRGGG